MRPIERIPIFLEKVDYIKLAHRWHIKKFDISPEYIYKPFLHYWLENPDQRFGQVLINLNLIPDKLKIWHDEEDAILLSQGIDPRDFIL